jgi:hypothetical protein
MTFPNPSSSLILSERRTREECGICEALRREYANSIMEHVKVVEKRNLYESLGDVMTSTKLERTVSFAECAREKARLAVVAHEGAHRVGEQASLLLWMN